MTDRMAVRYLARVRLYEKPRPAHGPFFYDAMSDALKEQSLVAPGRLTNMIINNLSGKTVFEPQEDFDGLPGQFSKIQPGALTMPWEIEWKPTQKNQWIRTPSTEEKAERALAVKVYEQSIVELKAEIEKKTKSNTPHKEEDELLRSAESILEQLQDGGYGYFRTAWNAMDTGVSGVWWGLAAANTPIEVTSGFSMEADRAFCIRLKRYKAPDGQVNHYFIIEFGDGRTLYAIVIGEDGNSAEFLHFRNDADSVKNRKKWRAQLERVLDRGRLTVEDRKKLLEWEEQEQALRAQIKESGRKKTDADNASLKKLQEDTQALRDSKKLTNANEEERRELERKLYITKEKFTLQQTSNDLIGKPIDITVQFLRAGFVIVTVLDSRYVYENKRITGKKRKKNGANQPEYATGLPESSYLTLKSNGGKWGIVYGHPKFANAGSFWSQVISIPFDFEEEDIVFDFEGDDSLPGCQIEAEFFRILESQTNGTVPNPARYQARLHLRSNHEVPVAQQGHFTPEVYRFGVHIKGGVVPDFEAPVWDSEAPANLINGKPCLMDTVVRSDKRRSTTAMVYLHKSGSNLPLNLGALMCDVALYDRQEGQELLALNKGMVKVNPMDRVENIDTAEGFDPESGAGSQVAFDVVGVENFLDVEIVASIIGNNRFPNDHYRAIIHDLGLHPSLYENLFAGDIGIPKTPRPQPGRMPDRKPAFGARGLEYIREDAKKHCHGRELFSDATGLRLERLVFRNRQELTYGRPPLVAVDSKLCLRGNWDGSRAPRLVQDISEYWTGATFFGASDPLTGIRYNATVTIEQAFHEEWKDKQSMFWIGRERHYTAAPDDSLRSKVECEKAAREFLNKTPLTPQGLPPWFLEVYLDFDPHVLTGDLVRIFGVKFLVDTVEFASLNAGEGQSMTAAMQLAEDRRPAGL